MGNTVARGESNRTPSKAKAVGFPVPNGTVSYWQARYRTSPLFSRGRDVPLPQDADVVIVGSGITGAVAAYNLVSSRPDLRVVMLEAREVCSGATGRNGGHMRPDMFVGFEDYSKLVGQEQAHKVLQNELDTLAYTQEIIEKEGIDCDLWLGETCDVFMNQKVKDQSRSSYDAYKAYGKLDEDKVTWVEDPLEAQSISRVKHCFGLAKWPAASFYPLKFVHGLLQKCEERGLRIFSHTLVESFSRADGGWTLETPRGKVHAQQIVLATNAYTNALAPIFRDHLLPCKEHCSAVVPTSNFSGPERPAGDGSKAEAFGTLKYTMGLTWGGVDFEYLVPRPAGTDGTWILGGAKKALTEAERVKETTDDSFLAGKEGAVRKHLAEYGKEQFMDWGEEAMGEGLERVHCGIIAHTRDSLPIVGEVPGEDVGESNLEATGLFVCAGWQGHGMARCATSARAIAGLLLASRDGQDTFAMSDKEWEELAGVPACFRWNEAKRDRKDVDWRHG